MNHTIPTEPLVELPPEPVSRFRPMRLIAKVLGGFFVIFLILALAIPIFFEKQIGIKLIEALNQQLTAEVQVESFDLSLFSAFPKAAATLKGVVFQDTEANELLRTEELSFHLGLLSLFSSEAKVNTVLVENGSLFLHVDKKGNGNYTIIAPTEGEARKDFSLAIEEAILKNIDVSYVDERGPQDIKVHVDEVKVGGVFSADEFDLDFSGNAICNAIDLNGHKYLVEKPVEVAGLLKINLPEKKYTFKNTVFDIQGNPLKLGGSIQNVNSETIFNLQALTKNGDVNSLIGFLPNQYTKYLNDLKSVGAFNMIARIKGRLGNKVNPSIDIVFGLEDGKIKSKKYKQSVKAVSFKGKFTNGKSNNNSTSVLEVNNFKGTFHGQRVALGFQLRNINHPKIKITADGKMPMKDLEGLLNLPDVSEGTGYLALKDIKISGRLSDLVNPEKAHQASMSGRLTFQDLSFKLNDQLVNFNDGRLLVSGNKISLDKLHFIGANSDMVFSGNCFNLMPILLADAEQRKNIKVRFNAKLDAPQMDLKALATLFSNDAEAATEEDTSEVVSHQFLTSILQGTFKANVDEFQYGKIEGKDFLGFFEIDNNELAIDGKAIGMDGQWILDGTLFLEEEPYAVAKLTCQGIQLSEFFEQTNNFGQEVLRSEHLEGKLLANLKVDAFWDEQRNFLMDDLLVLGDVAVSDGRLKNFEMLYEFSNYIKIQDLRDVRFTTMRNWLEVKERKIHIPQMFVQSNALNLELCGIHTFENKIDYSIRVNAGQVIANKFKKFNPKMLPQKKNRNGLIYLNYRIHGSVAKYNIKSDADFVKRRLRNTLTKKNRIKRRLLVEFGELNIPEDNWANWEYMEEVNEPDVPELEEVKNDTETIDVVTQEKSKYDELGPSKDAMKDEGFRLDDLLKKEKEEDSYGPPKNYKSDDDEELMDWEIEGEIKKPKKSGGG